MFAALVVREDGEGRYEVIDGQQRLTTIHITYRYLKRLLPHVKLNYTLVYQTRQENTAFFDDMENDTLAESNIDFHFIHKAYKTVKEWFSRFDDTEIYSVALRFITCFNPDERSRSKGKGVKVIWYELKDAKVEDAIALFTRLNIGRIPLTNAELVKALFLCRQNSNYEGKQLSKEKQQEIALQWDTIERELHDENFWYFLTNKQTESYPTRIELIFDFMASGETDSRDRYATFYYFSKNEDLQKSWEKITQYYYRLKEWYKKSELYHKIGYLVASRYTTIDVLMNETQELSKSKMEDLLDKKIKESIDFKKPYGELSYDNDYDAVTRILLLFNVVSIMKNNGGARFPFKEFNKHDKDNWSLEHIHAQNSLKLNTQEKWKEWLGHHIESVKGMAEGEKEEEVSLLLADINNAINNEHLTDVQFTELFDHITHLLSDEKSRKNMFTPLSLPSRLYQGFDSQWLQRYARTLLSHFLRGRRWCELP